ncbi:MAG: hypothetical protein ACJ75H_24430 [Thermoanaerobaculia bacterium]
MSDKTARTVLWWLCLLVAPAVLVTIELFHPAGFTQEPGMYQYLSKPEPYDPQFKALDYFGPHWWFKLHMIQTPMVALVAVGLWLMVSGLRSADGPLAFAAGWLSRISTFVFLIYYTALDSIGGFGLGRTILLTESLASQGRLSSEQLQGVTLVLNGTWVDPWVGGVGSFISETGSWAAFYSAASAASGLFFAKKAPWPALILLVIFGWELQLSHTMPHGPIAFALLIVAAAWIWFKGKPLAPDAAVA